MRQEILDLYRLDIAKYALENEKVKIKAIFGSILENAFAQNLRSNGFELHYCDSKKYDPVFSAGKRTGENDL